MDEIIAEAACETKLGPTTGPREKCFTRFQTHFNSLSREEKEEIRRNAVAARSIVGIEDDVTRDFFEATRSFFEQFESECDSYKRGDFKEFARLVMVNNK